MKLNRQIFHAFFYDPSGNGRGKSATRYSKGHFFSYNTEVGMLYNNGKGPVLFIADGHFSNTTSAHIHALRDACPFNAVPVPFDFEDDFTRDREGAIKTLETRFLHCLKNYTEADFTRKAARDDFNTTLKNFRAFLDYAGRTINKRDDSTLRALEASAEETPENKARRAEMIAKRAEKTRRENERKASALEKILKKWNVYTLTDKARFAFSDKKADPEARAKLRDLLQTEYPGFSFVWLNGDMIETSQGIRIKRIAARRAYSIYKAGKLLPGMHLGPYLIRELAADFVQIGCHKIAMQNINELAAAL